MIKFGLTAGAALLLSTSIAGAVGLDRSNQDITAIFETGNYAELSFGYVMPNLTGVDVLGNSIDNVGNAFSQLGGSVKMDFNDQMSFAFIIDRPFGADVTYGGSPAGTMLGGTEAILTSTAFTALGRYKFNDNFSVHGGVRYETLEADITLAGLAYGGLNGYNVLLENGSGTGYVVGVAYERPDIALRVALTYNSAITNEFDTTETLNGAPLGVGTTEVESPEAWNLDFQTGIAANTLVFGQIRHAMYSQTILTPATFGALTGGASITDIEDATSYSVGVGRKFSDAFSGSVAIGYEATGDDDLVSPLSPTDGLISISVGGQYTMDNLVFSGGIRYSMLGDARPETGTPDTARASFTDGDALSIGLSVGYRF
jgi:long-chain fatty acid transport protein